MSTVQCPVPIRYFEYFGQGYLLSAYLRTHLQLPWRPIQQFVLTLSCRHQNIMVICFLFRPSRFLRFATSIESIKFRLKIGNADSILNNFLGNSTVTSVKELHLFPAIQKNFIELNTALPASVACERLFSIAGRLFRSARCSMTDDHFEHQLLLRANSSL